MGSLGDNVFAFHAKGPGSIPDIGTVCEVYIQNITKVCRKTSLTTDNDDKLIKKFVSCLTPFDQTIQ